MAGRKITLQEARQIALRAHREYEKGIKVDRRGESVKTLKRRRRKDKKRVAKKS